MILMLPTIMIAQKKSYWQQPGKEQVDVYRTKLNHINNDTMQMYLCREIGMYYQEIQRDSSLYFFQQSLLLAQRLKLKLWEAEAYNRIGFILSNLGNYPGSLQFLLNAQTIAENIECEKNIWLISVFSKDENPVIARKTVLGSVHDHLGILYIFTEDMENRIFHFFESRKIAVSINNLTLLSLTSLNLGHAYLNLSKLDSALIFEQEALQYSNELSYNIYKGYILNLIGEIYLQKENYNSAKENFEKSIQINNEEQNLNFLSASYISLANYFLATGQTDSNLYFAKKGLETIQDISSPNRLLNAYNALADEYLRLAYHGLRAKDKSFNVDFKLELDESLPKVMVVPQDIGRVLLNLINNSFFACHEKSKNTNSDLLPPTSDGIYKPQVGVKSQKVGDKIEIRVKDNALGIPEDIREKIFQPFFTTKPTGQGTGLGLSLSYDIITKGHGGTIKVESSLNQGSIFKIIIPV
jgi:signal transduction histidine kinase